MPEYDKPAGEPHHTQNNETVAKKHPVSMSTNLKAITNEKILKLSNSNFLLNLYSYHTYENEKRLSFNPISVEEEWLEWQVCLWPC